MKYNRNLIYSLAIKYKGDYNLLRKAINDNENCTITQPQQKCIIIGDEIYPKSLYSLENPPYILFYEGNIDLLKYPKIAIVGSRVVSEYGYEVTKQLSIRYSKRNVIVSGMAMGTDRIAQINASRTIGIVANGLDYVYPPSNADLYQIVKKKGLLLSEYPLSVKPKKEYFPFRNRIIAGLCAKLVVPCARITGGTMTTVAIALKLGIDIYTVPHPINSIEGEGCNRLIEEGAMLILRYDDIV